MCGIIGITSTKPVSSSIINSLKKLEYRGYDSAGIATLLDGKINEANKLLSRKWSIEGQVIAGEKRGRKIGFPTCNLKLINYVVPRPGAMLLTSVVTILPKKG